MQNLGYQSECCVAIQVYTSPNAVLLFKCKAVVSMPKWAVTIFFNSLDALYTLNYLVSNICLVALKHA